MTQYDMKVLDKIGLLKMDFLGLANLTMLSKALDNIKQSHGASSSTWARCRWTTPRPTPCSVAARRAPCSSLKVAGMTRSVQELQPSTLGHLAALVALYRPGPMAHIPSYIARRDGREPVDAARPVAGRRARRELRHHRLPGPGAPGGAQAGRLQPGPGRRPAPRDGQEGQGGHGPGGAEVHRRRSSSTATRRAPPSASGSCSSRSRATPSTRPTPTAMPWSRIRRRICKANYPAEWFAAVLSTIAADTEKVVGVVGECRRLGVPILPPDVNALA